MSIKLLMKLDKVLRFVKKNYPLLAIIAILALAAADVEPTDGDEFESDALF